ncbi:MAG TPA: c(7)-type cytochrome triheme domain-containing protein [Usitatibacter sp.]|nr:c(7)-type cytochrome triheme domain-containing protein [Usitatibacter sp.]
MSIRIPILAIALALAANAALADDKAVGKATFEKTCQLCHGPGLAGAPRFGQAAEWAPRIKKGVAVLYNSALKGTPAGMPGKGGNLSLSDAEVKAAVDYMVAAAGGAPKVAAAEKPAIEKKAAEKPVPEKKAATVTPVKEPAAPANATPGETAPAKVASNAPVAITAVAPPAAAASRDPNSFNRLLAAPGKRNAPPSEDGIHDPGNAGTLALQPPLTAFNGLPPLGAGNRVNWVKSLGEQKIKPRWDRNQPDAAAVVMDLNIVREVKGSMPDVVYPHKQHTEWLDCSNCHPAIFIPQKGANQISMAAIMLGQKCGVCHGKVAFPVSECRLCHSKPKEPATQTAATPAATEPRR